MRNGNVSSFFHYACSGWRFVSLTPRLPHPLHRHPQLRLASNRNNRHRHGPDLLLDRQRAEDRGGDGGGVAGQRELVRWVHAPFADAATAVAAAGATVATGTGAAADGGGTGTGMLVAAALTAAPTS